MKNIIVIFFSILLALMLFVRVLGDNNSLKSASGSIFQKSIDIQRSINP